jgi:hypothetical protein
MRECKIETNLKDMQCDYVDWNHFSRERTVGVQYEDGKSVSGSI